MVVSAPLTLSCAALATPCCAGAMTKPQPDSPQHRLALSPSDSSSVVVLPIYVPPHEFRKLRLSHFRCWSNVVQQFLCRIFENSAEWYPFLTVTIYCPIGVQNSFFRDQNRPLLLTHEDKPGIITNLLRTTRRSTKTREMSVCGVS